MIDKQELDLDRSRSVPLGPRVERSPIDRGTAPIGGNGVAAAEGAAARSSEAGSRDLLVDPGGELAPHQLSVAQLFAMLRPAVTEACNRELARVHRSADNCPYIPAWLAYYESRPAAHVERAILHYTGGTAASAGDLMGLVVRQAVASVRRWIETGQIEGVPGGLDPIAPPAPASRHDVVAGLGPGTPLPAAARAPAERALGESFADVRLHADASADEAAREAGASAFAVGHHVGFAIGKFQPETTAGQLMIAHELAHVAQQPPGADVAEVATEDATLEDDADAAALAIVADAPAKVRRGGGLRLQRCTEKESKPTPSPPTPSPPPPPAHCVKPAIHVVKTGSQRFPDGTEAPAVQPIDVAAELACEKFELRGDWPVGATTYPAKTEVLPKVWDNNLPMVHVMIDGKPDEFDVPKWNLRPVAPRAAGVAPYATYLDQTTKSLVAKQTELDAWNLQQSSFKTHPEKWVEQRDALKKQVDDYTKVVNVLQIQQTMYNRFDPAIARLVAQANAERGLTGKDALDPNIVKAIIFNETEMGTSGWYVGDDDPRGDWIINHYNLTQAIDSFGEMYAEYFLQKDPTRTTNFHLANIKRDLYKAQDRKKVLEAKTTRTTAEQAELDDLVHKSGPPPRFPWEIFFREYPGLADAMNDLYMSPGPGAAPLNKTYEHWIEMMIFELFQKKKNAASWPEAVERYNGINPGYRKAVLKRAQDAAAAAKAKKPFVPTR